ncbi:uncharacterized protein EV422DRAFT_563548 [Fimicolochytrium jonesii]|uniref:uncharacterized protein n=1 Tax=Fimicolochytrium jonesii TaxID=1396493 RepID=UPI0022FDC94F|nr:uncharacterized protein EV422DRAFT_563548 [Fimicolochytrium jonesii]KAI8825717.1 hypothetical protein EV422DRAFT_563548 [Fimicolochytrium jonesii]
MEDVSVQLLDFQKQMATDLLSYSPVAPKSSSALAATAPQGSEGKGDGLLIAAKGLGLRNVLLAFLQIYADPRGLVLLLNTPSREVQVLKEDLMNITASRDAITDEEGGPVHPNLFRSINNETQASERSELYLTGGVLSVTSRILIVDMLNKVVPFDKVLGIIVNHAHRVTDTSTEAFILRLFRDDNKEGFIKALSDEPEAFTHGFWKLERSMKTLFQRHVFLWPRFHMTVTEDINRGNVQLHECKVKLTKSMKEIQAALIDCVDQCLAELRRSNPSIDAEELTVENAFFKSFDQLVRAQLDPIWHRVSTKTKLLVSDLKILRRLLSYLISYDCVTFNSFLETIVASNATDASAVFRAESNQSPWLLLDSAHVVLSAARQRVYRRAVEKQGDLDAGIPPGIEATLEEQPKWRVLRDILRQIEPPGPVLVMVDGDRSCNQLREIIDKCDLTFIKPEPEAVHRSCEVVDSDAVSQQHARSKGKSRKRALNSEETRHGEEKDNEPDVPAAVHEFFTPGSESLLKRLLKRYFKWKGGMSLVTKNLFRKAPSTSTSAAPSRANSGLSEGNGNDAFGRGTGRGTAPPNKRRRTRGGGSGGGSPSEGRNHAAGIGQTGMPVTFEEEAARIAEFLSQIEPPLEDEEPMDVDALDDRPPQLLNGEDVYTLIPSSHAVVLRPYATTSMSLAGASVSNGDDDARVLEDLRPEYVVMYDPDLGFVRRVECFKALNPSMNLNVYFMVYEDSVEEQRFLSGIRKEKSAFEKLIREKSIMAIPIDQDGRIARDPEEEFWRKLDTRLAGGQRIPAEQKNQVIVDVREFRSSLPSLIHAQRMTIRACTLEVGDYVLSPHICVERKSLSDLISSLKSGRLYTQCEAMSLHYKIPVLLIEFDKAKAFSLHSDRETKGEIDAKDVGSRLCLLCLHFPKLRMVWSSSPAATAEIFEDLKKNQEEPNMEEAMAVGVDNPETIDSAFAITPSDILRALPGITSKNYRYVMSKVRNIEELSEMGLEDCQELLGQEFGRSLYNFFRQDPTKEPPGAVAGAEAGTGAAAGVAAGGNTDRGRGGKRRA